MKEQILERILSLKERLKFSEESIEVSNRVVTRLINKLQLTENLSEHPLMLADRMEKEADYAEKLPEMEKDYTMSFLMLISGTILHEVIK